MQKESNAKYKMILSTSQRLSQNSSLVTTLPTYSTIYTQFSSDFTQLQLVCEQLLVGKSGVKLNKLSLRKDMGDKALDIMLKMHAYAKVTANELFKSECSFTKTDFFYKKEVQARNYAMVIYTKATANATALATYGVSTALLTALKTAIDAFTVAIPSTSYTKADKKDLMLKRDKYILACINSLQKIDALVEIIRSSQPTFYTQYKEARKLMRTRTSLSLKGQVKDSLTGETISGVSISLLPVLEAVPALRAASAQSEISSETAVLLNKRSATKGGFYIKNLPAGVYTLSLSKYGYATSLQTITVNPGETTSLYVQLEKTA